MKKIKTLLVAATALLISGSAMAEGYNRIGLSYNNDQYSFNKDYKMLEGGEDPSFSTNGFGINYVHGFGVSPKLPMFLEVGGQLNFNFCQKSYSEIDEYDVYLSKLQYQNINLAIPVNFAYRFSVAGGALKISPYLGINFRINMAMKGREYDYDTNKWEKWTNFYSSDEKNGMGNPDATWNVFQMGWQIGGNIQWKCFYAGLEYGTDFVPAYRHSFTDDRIDITPAVNTGRFRMNIGLVF